MNEDIYNRFKQVLAKQPEVDISKVNPDARFVEDLKMDSLSLVELFFNLGDEFGDNIDDKVIQKIKTIGEAVAYLEESGVQ